MIPLEYLHLQMRLEGKEVIDKHCIRQVEIVPDEALPLLLRAQFYDGTHVVYVDEALPTGLQKQLIENQVEFPHLEPLLDILRRENIPFNVGHYKTYIFSSPATANTDVRCLSKDDPRVKDFGFDGFAEEVYTVERNDQIVSACVSTRENKTCGEAWVYTDPEHRNQGLAQKVVRAWAGSLTAAGKVPFYSHGIENTASANLARKLGLQPVFEEISVNPVLSDET